MDVWLATSTQLSSWKYLTFSVLVLTMVNIANGAIITMNTATSTTRFSAKPTTETSTTVPTTSQSDTASSPNWSNHDGSDGRRPTMHSEKTTENLVAQWAPLVWLAPNEQFMPGRVNEFLSHVHAEKQPTPVVASGTTAQLHQQDSDILDVSDDLLLYELDREIGVEMQKMGSDDRPDRSPVMDGTAHKGRDRRFSLDIDLPVGVKSKDWFLVSNVDIDSELQNKSSFLYGQDPNRGQVPIYSSISICNTFEATHNLQLNEIGYSERIDRRPSFTPTNSIQDDGFPYKFESPVLNPSRPKRMPRQISRVSKLVTTNHHQQQTPKYNHIIGRATTQVHKKYSKKNLPYFHVTYWMFYPYNQGKTICTLNLGPLGRLPIPVIFGKCLGTRRDFGSHVGDWEHMTLYFRGQNEPEEMYVSAHDAGAYYSYDTLSGSFNFRRQETRKGILQHPNFPKTVRTINNHPVLFSAQGSHGLWTAPGKHRFVRLPRLVDINGFGTPWYTWKNIEFLYESKDGADDIIGGGRSMIGPRWLQFMGKWGNRKSKCHPLKRLGLNFCEYNDGPTGIPMKEPHFSCK